MKKKLFFSVISILYMQLTFYSCGKSIDLALIGYWQLDSISIDQGKTYFFNTTKPIKEVIVYFNELNIVSFGLYGGSYTASGNKISSYVQRGDESLLQDTYWTKQAVACLNKSEQYTIENNILTIYNKENNLFKFHKL